MLQIKSNQIKSNQIKSNQIKSNQIKHSTGLGLLLVFDLIKRLVPCSIKKGCHLGIFGHVFQTKLNKKLIKSSMHMLEYLI